MDINVQFSDGVGTSIASYFCCPQDASLYPNLGVVQASDARWKAFYDAANPMLQRSLPTPI